MVKLFPSFRHIVVITKRQRFPVMIKKETDLNIHTSVGTFSKFTRGKCDDPTIKYEGPFTAEGDMECRL